MVAAPSRRVILLTDPNYYVRRWGVVSHWKLDEASGAASDSVGANHLSATNNPVSGAGKVGSARAFVAASSQYLSIADNVALSTGDVDFWVAGWVYLSTTPASNMWILTRWSGAAGEFVWGWIGGATNRFRFQIYNGGVAKGTVTASTFGALSTATWYFVMIYHDSVNNTVNISVNGGAFDSAATTGVPADSTDALVVGSLDGTQQYWNGRLDEVTFGKSPPNGIAGVATEIRDRLYAGGAGRQSPWL